MNTAILAGGPALVRAAMAEVIEASRAVTVVGQAADSDQFRGLLKEYTSADVILLDRMLQDRDVPDFTELVSVASEAARTIVFGVPDTEEAEACLRAGATGVLAAGITAAQLVATLETVLRGGLVVVLETAPAITVPRRRTPGPERLLALSRREREILTLLAGGQESPAVADALGISPLTVKTHIAHMLTKIGVRRRGQLIAFAYENGLVVPGATPLDPLVPRLSEAS